MKNKITTFLKIATSLALILILLYIMRGKYDQIITALKGTNVAIFGLAVLIFFVAIAIASLRLKLIITAQGLPVTFRESISLTFIGYFFNNFLPTTIGGDVIKAYYISKKSQEKMGAYTAVFVDRAIGLFTMVFMAFVALLFESNLVIDKGVKQGIYAITAASALVIIFMMNKNFARKFSILLLLLKPLEDRLRRAYNSVHKYRQHSALVTQSFAISIFSQVLFYTSIGILALSIGSHVSTMFVLLSMPIISAMSLLPSINGLGLREGATVLMFGPLIGKENAFVVSILWLAVLLIASVVGGLVYALSPQFKISLKEIEKRSERYD